MNNIDPHAYTVMTKRVEIDGESYFEATVRELPDVRDYGETQQEAYDLAIDTIKTAAEMYEEENRTFPMPARQVDDYSGRITLRMLPEVHYMVDMAAMSNRVSINHYVNSILTFYAGRSLTEPQREWKSQIAYTGVGIVTTSEDCPMTSILPSKEGCVYVALGNTADKIDTMPENLSFSDRLYEKNTLVLAGTHDTK